MNTFVLYQIQYCMHCRIQYWSFSPVWRALYWELSYVENYISHEMYAHGNSQCLNSFTVPTDFCSKISVDFARWHVTSVVFFTVSLSLHKIFHYFNILGGFRLWKRVSRAFELVRRSHYGFLLQYILFSCSMFHIIFMKNHHPLSQWLFEK